MMHGAYYTRKSDGAVVNMLFNEVSGWWTIHTGGGGSYNNPIATSWATGPWVSLTESHALAIQRDLDKVKTGSATATGASANAVKVEGKDG